MLEFKQPPIPSDINLYEQLELSGKEDSPDVDAAWCDLAANRKGRMAHFAWKLLRDSAYSELYDRTGSIDEVYDAGFFVDRLNGDEVNELEFKNHDLTTPYHKITNNLESLTEDDTPIVFVTTGGFSPITYGHISMMETARNTLEAKGRKVVGGYISPSHDAYVDQKYGGEARLSANHRIHLVQQAVDDSEWLMADPWESLYLSTDINFTDVVRRLKTYLNHFIDFKNPLEVYYVYGADNLGFTKVMHHMDGGMCVSRDPKYNELPDVFKDETIAKNPNLIFVPSDAPESEFSSSKVRQWKPLLMPKVASQSYFKWRINSLNEDHDIPQPPRHYIVRDDGEWALKQFFPDVIPDRALESLNAFKSGIALAIKNAFEEVELPDVSQEVNVHYFSLEEQRELAHKLMASRPTLNIDACTNEGENGINFSRLFETCEGQLRPYDLISRPGFPSIEEQVSKIQSGDYLFLDDDIATGSTLNHLIGLLPKDIKINAIRTLFNESRRLHKEFNTHEVSDIVDLKDFIIGAYGSGLVVTAPDRTEVARAPYMLPFVTAFTRATIPLSSMKNFSRECWRLNQQFFGNLDKEVLLNQASPEFQALMTQLDFDNSTPLTKVAKYYSDLLNK